MDFKQFLEQFQNFLAPKLDTYEQALISTFFATAGCAATPKS